MKSENEKNEPGIVSPLGPSRCGCGSVSCGGRKQRLSNICGASQTGVRSGGCAGKQDSRWAQTQSAIDVPPLGPSSASAFSGGASGALAIGAHVEWKRHVANATSGSPSIPLNREGRARSAEPGEPGGAGYSVAEEVECAAPKEFAANAAASYGFGWGSSQQEADAHALRDCEHAIAAAGMSDAARAYDCKKCWHVPRMAWGWLARTKIKCVKRMKFIPTPLGGGCQIVARRKFDLPLGITIYTSVATGVITPLGRIQVRCECPQLITFGIG